MLGNVFGGGEEAAEMSSVRLGLSSSGSGVPGGI